MRSVAHVLPPGKGYSAWHPLWNQTYNSELDGSDYGYDLAFGLDGSIYVTGLVGMQTAGEGQNIVLLKFQPIPEPATLTLLVMGGLGFLLRRRR